MPRALKQCGRRGCMNRVPGGTPYCPEHTPQRTSPSSNAARYDPAERARHIAIVKAWVETYGLVCPGWQRPPHPSTDLTAAHTIAVARGGKDSPLTVLCRSCNARQGATPMTGDTP